MDRDVNTQTAVARRGHSLEREIIGSVLQDRRLYDSIRHLRPTDFAEEGHPELWEAIQQVASQGIEIAVQSVGALVFQFTDGDLAAMAHAATANFDGVRSAAERLSNHRRRQQVLAVLDRGITKIQESPENWEVIVRHVVDYLSQKAEPTKSMTNEETIAILKAEVMRQNSFEPVPTGITAIDNRLGGGLRPGLYTVGGLPKVGKTTFLATISGNVEKLSIPHLCILAEKNATAIAAMKIARLLGTNVTGLRFIPTMESVCRYVHQPNIAITAVRNEVLYHVRHHGCRLVMIDYMQLIGGKDPRETANDFIDRVGMVLQQTALDAEVPVIVMYQLGDGPNARAATVATRAAHLCITMQRDIDDPKTWFEMQGTSICDETNIGGVNSPAMLLKRDVGPYFRNPDDTD